MSNSGIGKRYTFVTIVYEEEYELLLLQARSLRLYCPIDIIETIIVIDNSNRALSPKWRRWFLHEYGHFADRVQIIRASDIARMPPAKGWKSQQILKLMIASRVSTDRYLILDAKNHLVFPLQLQYLESDDGRPRTHTLNYENNPLRRHLERTLAYFGIPPEPHISHFTASTTPFIMYADIARQLVSDVGAKEGMPFEVAFLKFRLTEFFAYACHIIKTGTSLKNLYDFHQRACPCIWEHTASAAGCRTEIERVVASGGPFFAIHKNAIRKLDPAARSAIAGFWADKNLFETASEARDFLDRLRTKLSVYKFVRPLANLPIEVARRLATLRRT